MASTRVAPVSSPPQAYDSSSLQRKPTKKTSFLSLKRGKRPADMFGSSLPTDDSFPSGHAASDPLRAYEADGPSYRTASQPHSSKSYRSKVASKSIGSMKEVHGHRRAKGSRGQLRSPGADHQTFDFPVSADDHHPWPSGAEEELDLRGRATSSPSIKHDWERGYSTRVLKYPYRDSGSSTLSHFETPPQTPLDDYSFKGRSYPVPVVVAAPIPGVETMDALVDGMNGFTEDEQFVSLTGLSGRSQYKKTGYHPLYHPPLPTPPPGVKLGGGLLRGNRKQSDSDSDPDSVRVLSPKRSQRDPHNNRPPRTAWSSTVTQQPAAASATLSTSSSQRSFSSRDEDSHLSSSSDKTSHDTTSLSAPREVVPSISDIIKTYAPASQQTRTKSSLSRRTSYATTYDSSVHQDSFDVHPDPIPIDEESDIISRSSVDTIAEEVRQTIRHQTRSNLSSGPPAQSVPFPVRSRPQSVVTDLTRSPLSEGNPDSSLYNYSSISDQPPLPPMDLSCLTKAPINSPSQMIAQYLRSSRLTTVMKLTRSPHASRESPLNISFSDLGSPTGLPLVVFLGLGCVRHIMGLYDEMAECLGIRLITIDRWGLGRTGCPRSKLEKGIPEWASVVEEVLDRLKLDQCSVMAHSAGAPYALAFANRFPERIRGDICLLAPWVGGGEGAGYKWLKYVPNGILKTAQAAEWKVQAWMLGKPPTIAYEGIGFDIKTSGSPSVSRSSPWPLSPTSTFADTSFGNTANDDKPRPSISSGAFSDYDDLRDFDGRFESGSTLGRKSSGEQRVRTISESKQKSRKPSRGFLGRLRGTHNSTTDDHMSSGTGKKLKALRSMGSLKGRSASAPLSHSSKKGLSASLLLQSPDLDVGLGLEGIDWDATIKAKRSTTKSVRSNGHSSHDVSYDAQSSRGSGRRSVSFGANMAKSNAHERAPPVPSIPPLSPTSQEETSSISYQAALGNALIAASHAESAKGTHGDLLQILNHDRLPWGFSYGAYPHKVRVWYGDHDEKIAENAVRWMENTMGQDKCQVKVVKGADHSLMFKSSIVVEVLEYIAECWRSD